MQVEFVGQSAQDTTARPANTSRLLNYYRERVEDGGLTRYILKPVPGMVQLVDLSRVYLRAMEWINGKVYTVAGGDLIQVATNGDIFSLASVEDGEETTISGNGTDVTVCAAGRYWVWDGGALSEPTGAAFSSFGSVASLGGYTLLTERNGRRFQWTDLADPETFDPLNFATTESGQDENIRGIVHGDRYWIFKERSVEIWYNTGLADAAAFERAPGGVLDVGLYGFNLVTSARDMLAFVGSDGIVRVSAGEGLTPVSTRPVEEAITAGTATHLFYYERDGHKFVVLRFSDRPAWVYDLSGNEWHERAEDESFMRWNAIAAVEAGTKNWWVGSPAGIVYQLQDVLTDKGGNLYRRAVSRTARFKDGTRVKSIEFFGAWGYTDAEPSTFEYLAVGDGYLGISGAGVWLGAQGNEPELRMKVSKDGGGTFGLEKRRPIGAKGEYRTRVIFRGLGLSRQFTVQVEQSHEWEIPIFADAELEIA